MYANSNWFLVSILICFLLSCKTKADFLETRRSASVLQSANVVESIQHVRIITHDPSLYIPYIANVKQPIIQNIENVNRPIKRINSSSRHFSNIPDTIEIFAYNKQISSSFTNKSDSSFVSKKHVPAKVYLVQNGYIFGLVILVILIFIFKRRH